MRYLSQPLLLPLIVPQAPLQTESVAVQRMQVKDLVYLRKVLSFSKEHLSAYTVLTDDLDSLMSHKEAPTMLDEADFMNEVLNLRVDHCLYYSGGGAHQVRHSHTPQCLFTCQCGSVTLTVLCMWVV